MKIVFAGTPEFAAAALAALLKMEHEIVAVYTQPDRPAGRGQKLSASPVKQLALEHHLLVKQPLHFKSSTEEGLIAQQELAALDADVMVVAAYGLILPQAVLDLPRLGCLNIHASLLPRWRGAAPIQRAILEGDQETGITIMQMAKGLDTGDMLYKISTPILAQDTSASLHDRLMSIGATAICDVLSSEQSLLDLQATHTVQDEKLTNYAQKFTKSEARIDWSKSANILDLYVRGFNPWPVTFCYIDEHTTLRIWAAEIANQKHSAAHGTIIEIDKHGVLIACGDATTLRLQQVQWPGGKALNSVQILQAQKLQVGQVLL